MPTGFISDLHVDRNRHVTKLEFIKTLQDHAENNALDQLIILGDITNFYESTLEFMDILETNQKTKYYFVPGNHDFWDQDKKFSSTWEIYDKFKESDQSLIGKPLKINDQVTLITDPAWYNYAYASPEFTKEELSKGQFKWGSWQDKKQIDWGMSDPWVSNFFAEGVRMQIENVTTDNIWLATHIVTLADLCPPLPHKVYDYFNAYIGTSDFNDLIEEAPITRSIMGHVHHRVTYNKGNVLYSTVCLGYSRQWRSPDVFDEIHRSLLVLDG